jgi:Protein of unknown function (DUF3309)
MLGILLIILLVVLILAVIPAWPYSSGLGVLPRWHTGSGAGAGDFAPAVGYLVMRTGPGNPSQNSLFKADAYVRAVAGVEFWDWFGVRQLLFWYNLPEQRAKCYCSQDCLIRVSTLITDLTPPAT